MNETSNEPFKEAQIFSNQLNHRCSEYVELTLQPFIGEIMDIANEKESLDSMNFEKVENISNQFNDRWKSYLNKMNNEIMRSFTNFKNGTDLLQQALNELIQYYAKFHKNVSSSSFNNLNMISVHQVMLEVKKYKTSF